jgi:PAS domain S-box-containing protein
MDFTTLYRDIVETSPDGTWVIDAEGRTMYANRAVADLLGRTPEEVHSLSVFDALDSQGRKQFARHLKDLRRGDLHDQDVECLWVRKDGTRLWVLLRESVLRGPDGAIQGFLHRVSDYTERRRLFDELSLNRHRLAEAQRIAKVGSWEWDLRTEVITASDELHELYAVPREVFDGSYTMFLAMVHEDDRAGVDAVVQAARDGKDEFEFDARVHRGDGSGLVWTRGRGVLTRDEHGEPVLMRGTHQDISDAKAAEHTLRDLATQNGLMQVMASAANEAETLVEVLAVAQSALLQHDDWVRARGYLPRDGEPDGLLPLFLDQAERDADERRPELTTFERGLAVRALQTRTSVWDETAHSGRPSIAFPVMLGERAAAIIVITASTPFERQPMIQTMIDQVAVQLGRVAEREAAANDLAAARDAAMEASRQKSEFLATMSHEIRTPLNGVIGLNDLLLRTELDAHQQRLASGTQVASRALLGVINDILDFSKIEAGKLELENVDFEVRAVFDQVASLLGESARSQGLELLVSCHPEVPELLNGDPTRLAQLLTNLGSNAVKFTEQGEVSIRATAFPAEGGCRLHVEVTDTGVGVAPEKQAAIFEPFSQEDASTTRRYGGTGLGLAISSEIAAALGGEIGVTSASGEGSTFWFTACFRAAGSRPAEMSSPRSPDALAGRRVLVVDDNANNRLILSEHLTRWDIQSTTVDGAVRAVEHLTRAVAEDDPFDAVLLDMAMPECDGLDLAAMIAADQTLAGTPLIMLTSSTQPDAAQLEAAGIAECLTKPVLAGEVLDALLRVVVGHAAPVLEGPATVRPARGDSDRYRLLVVEDNPVNQLVALGILETLGYAADTANDGVHALERWQDGYDAILMDVQMPRMDGYATTRAIRARESAGDRIPILAMTAAAVEGERERCLAAGMDDFLTKPVDPHALGKMLLRWLSEGPPDAPAAASRRAVVDGVLDLDRLDMLRDLDPGNTSYLDKAIANFASRAAESLQAIRDAVCAEDREALTQTAHRLKGSALNLGLPVVGHLAFQLEMLGDAGTGAGASSLLTDLEGALRDAVTAVQAYQRDYAG